MSTRVQIKVIGAQVHIDNVLRTMIEECSEASVHEVTQDVLIERIDSQNRYNMETS